MLEVLIAELESIDDQAFEMAVAIVQHPALRSKLADKAKLLKKRLLEIAAELERTFPAIHKERFNQISEAFLDHDFVEKTGLDITSLRLGSFVEAEKR